MAKVRLHALTFNEQKLAKVLGLQNATLVGAIQGNILSSA
jgi:hypothetical protein